MTDEEGRVNAVEIETGAAAGAGVWQDEVGGDGAVLHESISSDVTSGGSSQSYILCKVSERAEVVGRENDKLYIYFLRPILFGTALSKYGCICTLKHIYVYIYILIKLCQVIWVRGSN